MMENCASIDIGTFTARLLIARKPEAQERLRPLARRRAYIRLGEGFSRSYGGKTIQPEAIDRTLIVLKDFLQYTKLFDVHEVRAVATGVVRDATNRDAFLASIHSHTGLQIRPISGEEEALLTGKGVLAALQVQCGPFLVFDLGGGSTEFFFTEKGAQFVRSIPLGSMVLKQAFIKSDPPGDEQVEALSRHMDQILGGSQLETIDSGSPLLIAGTGGTVTTLAAMLNGIYVDEMTPERINGLTLTLKQLEELFDKLKRTAYEERLRMPGLDPTGRRLFWQGVLRAQEF